MEPTDELAHILPSVVDVVDRIDVEQLNDPTPCDEFTVHDVLDHMIVLGGTFAYGFRGEEPPEITAPPVYGRVPTKEFRTTMDDLLDAVRSPGAMDRTVESPFGPVPGRTFARMVALDGLLHGWDLATATGQPYAVDPDVVAGLDEFARAAITDEVRSSGAFAEPQLAPAGAGRLADLVAFSGRTV